MEKLKNLWAKVKQHKKQAIIGVVIVAVISAGLAIYNQGNANYTIDISQIFKIECSGHSGEGKPSITTASGLDKESFIKNILLKLYPNASNDYIKYSQYKDFLNSITFEFNKKENLSNGDEITATASYDKAQAKTLKLNLKNTTLKTTVSDLYELIDGNTQITDDLKNTLNSHYSDIGYFYLEGLEKNLDETINETIENKYLRFFYPSNYESITADEKYILKPKNKSDAVKVVYLYNISLEKSSFFNIEPAEQSSCVVALTLPDIYYNGKGIDYYTYISDSRGINFGVIKNSKISCYKTLDEAKQKILDQDNYEVEEL